MADGPDPDVPDLSDPSLSGGPTGGLPGDGGLDMGSLLGMAMDMQQRLASPRRRRTPWSRVRPAVAWCASRSPGASSSQGVTVDPDRGRSGDVEVLRPRARRAPRRRGPRAGAHRAGNPMAGLGMGDLDLGGLGGMLGLGPLDAGGGRRRR